jgi:multisubunit Na+/H+ antiporter MnhC subunit
MRFKRDNSKFYQQIYPHKELVLAIAILVIIGSWIIGFSYKSPLITGIGLITGSVILIILGNSLKNGDANVSESNTTEQTIVRTERQRDNQNENGRV